MFNINMDDYLLMYTHVQHKYGWLSVDVYTHVQHKYGWLSVDVYTHVQHKYGWLSVDVYSCSTQIWMVIC